MLRQGKAYTFQCVCVGGRQCDVGRRANRVAITQGCGAVTTHRHTAYRIPHATYCPASVHRVTL